MRLVLAMLLAASAIGACTLLDDDPPDDRCTTDSQCFRAQGEYCNLTKHRCEQRVFMDAGLDAP